MSTAGKTRKHGPAVWHIPSCLYALIILCLCVRLNLADAAIQETLRELVRIYESAVKPLETIYRYSDLNKDASLEAEILAKPLILLVGPWSTGKTSIINYLLNIEDGKEKLHTGAEPTTTDFVVLQNGTKYRTMAGMQLVSDKSKPFAILERYGQVFIQRLQSIELKSPLLQLFTIVDTPGIIETKKQQERGYPFYDVLQWFLQRASLIFLVYDPTKLDAGLDTVFKQLKGHEAKVKILINKADTVSQKELMRVYGALFWNLAPLIQSVEPPRVYIGSFWSKSKSDHPLAQLFLEEEEMLMHDLYNVAENLVEDKIASIRRHAFMVRLHALTVDSFLQAFEKNRGWFSDPEAVCSETVHHPQKYNVFQKLMQQADISKHDLPSAETYINFFSNNRREIFPNLQCGFFGGCYIEKITQAISNDLPLLLKTLKEQKQRQTYCTKETC
ncbi:unnamed protein product [Candidula unifasciata]|uniref:Dynamin-type G domain-containing protein n=1 Tax=Candidula unifasciata TaxID=100452 RepID=A0A8S3YCV5_9EUPU|nr:unnamed protein product [Candidula unifasciata]